MLTRIALACCLSAAIAPTQSPLTTLFASNNNASGNLFDVVALNDLTIQSFDVNLVSGTWDIEVYTLPTGASYLPEVNNPSAWTLIGAAAGVVSNGPDVPTPLPICLSTFVPAGSRQAFYVTTTSTAQSMRYTNGTATGALFASNADLELYEGSGSYYAFQNNFNPRIWNGNIYYELGDRRSVIVETFSTAANQAPLVSSGRWGGAQGPGARPGLLGGDGRHGSFDPALGTALGNNIPCRSAHSLYYQAE